MGKTMNKLHSSFSIFLIFTLVAVVAGAVVYMLTSAEQRGVTFWISMGTIALAWLILAIFSSKMAFQTKSIVPGFSQIYLLVLYFIFVIGVAILNAFKDFSTTTLFLIHIIGAAIFLVPLAFSNMMTSRLNSAERKEQRAGRLNLAVKATQLRNKAELLATQNVAKDQLDALRKLADDLQYSDPTPASRDTENAMSDALSALTDAIQAFSAASANGEGNWQLVQQACLLAKQTLEERNLEVRNAK